MSAEDRARMLKVQQLLLDDCRVSDVEVVDRQQRATLWDSIRFDITLTDGFTCETVLVSNNPTEDDLVSGTVYADKYVKTLHYTNHVFFEPRDAPWAECLTVAIMRAAEALREQCRHPR
jgi:hypothetical protein